MSPVPFALPPTLSLEKHSGLSLIKHISMQFLTPDRVQSVPIYPTRGNLSFLLVESGTTEAKSIPWLMCGGGSRHLRIISDFQGINIPRLAPVHCSKCRKESSVCWEMGGRNLRGENDFKETRVWPRRWPVQVIFTLQQDCAMSEAKLQPIWSVRLEAQEILWRTERSKSSIYLSRAKLRYGWEWTSVWDSSETFKWNFPT